MLFRSHESTINTKGDVNILAKYDIHVHDHKSSKSYVFNFDKGKLKVAGTKTVKEHFYGEAPVPTLYYNHGNFYGYSEGKVHLMGPTLNERVKSAILILNWKIMDCFIIAILCVCDR